MFSEKGTGMSVQIRSILVGASFLLFAAVACGADPAPPAAEGFKTLTPSPTLTADKKKRMDTDGLVRRIINGAALSGNEISFDGYFTSYVFPTWTQTTEANLNDLPKERDKFVRNSLELSGKNPAAHARLIDITNRELSKIAQDPEFHPAVRYNAILIVGLLNETEPNRTGAKQLPEPYSKALTTLIEELKKPGNNEAVRVGALLGVSRHLEWDNHKQNAATKIQPAVRVEILAELNSIVSTKVPPAGRSPEGQTWLRRRALEALGHAFALQVDASFAKVLEDIITSDAEPISLRCTAAEVMSRVDYKAPVALPIVPTAKNLGYLALYACHTELLRLENLKKKDEELVKISGGGGGTPGGGMAAGGGGTAVGGGGPGASTSMMQGMAKMPGMGGNKGKGTDGKISKASMDPLAYRVDYSKRRLRAELYAVQLALGEKKKSAAAEPSARGVIAYAKAETETKAVDNITSQVKAVIREVETLDQDMATYEKSLRAEMKKLENLTRPLPVAAKTEVAKPAAVPEEEIPTARPAAKAPAEEPAEEVPMVPAAKAPAGKAPPAAPADEGKAAPADAGKAPPADAGKAPPAEKNP